MRGLLPVNEKAVAPDFAHVYRKSTNPMYVMLAGSGPSSMELVLIIAFSLTFSVPKLRGNY